MTDKDDRIELLRKALIGWMIEHGDRCRICSERSQNALKGMNNDWGHEAGGNDTPPMTNTPTNPHRMLTRPNNEHG